MPCIFTNNSSCWIYCDLLTFTASLTFLGSEKVWILSICSLLKTTLRGHLVQNTGEDVGSGQEGLGHRSYSEGHSSATPSHFHCRSGCRTGGWGHGKQLGMFSITRMEAPNADPELLAQIKGQLHVTNHNYKQGVAGLITEHLELCSPEAESEGRVRDLWRRKRWQRRLRRQWGSRSGGEPCRVQPQGRVLQCFLGGSLRAR